MRPRGFSLVELIVVMAIVMIGASIAIPSVRAYAREAHVLGAGRVFKGEFLKARSLAVRRNVYTAIRFETGPGGTPVFSVYQDGNHNGVLSSEIATGVDRRLVGPLPLAGGAPDVRVGILEGTPAIPPESGQLDPADPIRFGRSNLLSFSPLGTATPGTFYLAGDRLQAAVRVVGTTARVRFLLCRNGRWEERS